MVLHGGDDDLITRANILPPVGLGHQVYAFGGAPHIDDLMVFSGVDELPNLAAGSLVIVGGQLAEGVDATVDVGVRLLVVVDDGIDHLSRLGAPTAIGLDETSWLAATATHPTLLVTGIVDLDRGQLVDVIPARSAAAVEDWLASKPARWAAGIRHAVIDPYQPYATALANEVPDAKLVVDHFHVIRLANQALDEVRRRVQHATMGHRGRKGDPLYRIRRRLLLAREKLSDDAFDRVLAWPERGDPDGEVSVAYLAKELLREVYDAETVFDARRRLVEFYELCDEVDVHELSRLAKTIRRWETPLLRWHTTGLTNAGTEGTNLIIKNIMRLGFGFRNFKNYRLRLLLRCGTTPKTRAAPSIRGRQPSLAA